MRHHYFIRWIGLLSLLQIVLGIHSYGQSDSSKAKLNWHGDFRFRAEADWNSRKPEGTFRDDRMRLRYRFRIGGTYTPFDNVTFGARIRTGDPRKQQDPQLTLGQKFSEFSTLPIGLEAVYMHTIFNSGLQFWLGKNKFPFYKQNELFWSDNVYPEGISIDFGLKPTLNIPLTAHLGHFIMQSMGGGFDNDRYFQGTQLEFFPFDKRLILAGGWYYFHQVPNIPDGFETFTFNYSIAHFSGKLDLIPKQGLTFEVDLYKNFSDYSQHDSIPLNFQNQTAGLTAAIGFGTLEKKNDWHFKLTYTYLERYSAVDFLAQNDWARWDYSSFGSPDGRLTNMQGLEFVVKYQLAKNMALTAKYYHVNQLLTFGPALETNDRFRIDIDYRFR